MLINIADLSQTVMLPQFLTTLLFPTCRTLLIFYIGRSLKYYFLIKVTRKITSLILEIPDFLFYQNHNDSLKHYEF